MTNGQASLTAVAIEKSVRRIAVFEMMQLIAAADSMVTQRQCFDAGTIEETLDPCRNGNVEVDPSGVNEAQSPKP